MKRGISDPQASTGAPTQPKGAKIRSTYPNGSEVQFLAMIGRLHHIVIDCPNPLALATFYSPLLGLPVTFDSSDWVVISSSDTASGIAFQLCSNFQAPHWPDPQWPQQFHLDVMVDDLDEAELQVIELGAKKLTESDRVFSDPAGHPFCLVKRPEWAPPIHA
jgi:hypothetical protein